MDDGQYLSLSDMELAALLKQGNHRAFRELYNRYWEPLLNTAFKRLESLEAAEDLVQDLFVNLYLKRDTLWITTTMEGYLKTALKHKVLNAYRSQKLHQRYADHILTRPVDNDQTPQQMLQVKELAIKVEAATRRLPEKSRQVFLLSRVERLSNKEIAAQLNISVSTVEKHIGKAIKLLKSDLQGYHFGMILLCCHTCIS